jgi:hypothetical protein
MNKNIIITGANSPYYEGLLTLINSIQKHSYDIIDEIVVYDFGLCDEEINRLNSLDKVSVIDIRDEVKNNYLVYDTFSSTKTLCHFLKMFALKHSMLLSENVCWVDSGSMTLKSVKPIFDELETEHIFVVGDVHLNKNYTHKKCIEIMSATESELNDVQLSSGLFGFKSNGKFKQLILDSWEYSKQEGCVDGFEENHRHDQSVLSILCSRYNVKKNDIDIYGYWTDYNRTYQKAIEIGAVIFAGRRGIYQYSELKYKN